MVKLFFLCRRRPDIDHARYAARLLDGHVPIALRHHPSMRRYVVNIVDGSPSGWQALDSIGELSFDSLADFRDRLYDSPEGRAVVERDVAGFLGGADAYTTTEHVQKARPDERSFVGKRTPGVKMVCPIIRRTGTTHAEFVEHWLRRHAPLALAHHPGLVKYVTNVVDERLSSTGDDLDGIAELHFASEADLRERLFDSPEGEQAVRDDIARFIGRVGAYVVAEHVAKV
jgi:uncharacterized protein (TIGR02118 family)